MKKRVFVYLITALLALAFAGCANARSVGSDTPAVVQQPVATASAEPGRQDGERFEAVILLEGMEETVRYEHVRSEALGFELDYEYEDLVRLTDAESERFVSAWDDPADPWNYLELRRYPGDAEAVAASVGAALSESYDSVVTEPFTFEHAGDCLSIRASGARSESVQPGSLQTVYILPAGESCLVAAAHCTYESAEGFGARFGAMLNTLTLR